jgi:hypothetical protein
MTTFHDFEVKTIDGDARRLSDYKGKVLLVVNVASRCGLTPQYAGLEKLYRELKDKGSRADQCGRYFAAEAALAGWSAGVISRACR